MKKSLITLLLLLILISGFSQNSGNYYFGRLTPPVKKEKLPEATTIHDMLPSLWINLVLPYKDRVELEKRRKMEYAVGYYLYPLDGYDNLVDYVSVEISVICNGQVLTSQSTNEKLTAGQKNIINTADMGSDISIKIKYTYKNGQKDNPGSDRSIMEGVVVVTVIPETEAEFPGGFNQLTKYMMENIINKISKESSVEKIQRTIVKFTVDEQGQIVDAKISNTSTDQKIDKLILDAMNKMPVWRPAENSKGIKVKQEFTIPFGGGIGC
jgi:TonB family protein